MIRLADDAPCRRCGTPRQRDRSGHLYCRQCSRSSGGQGVAGSGRVVDPSARERLRELLAQPSSIEMLARRFCFHLRTR